MLPPYSISASLPPREGPCPTTGLTTWRDKVAMGISIGSGGCELFVHGGDLFIVVGSGHHENVASAKTYCGKRGRSGPGQLARDVSH